MRLTGWRFLAAVSALAAAVPAGAATRPRYGGTLRLEMRKRVVALDPAGKPASAAAVPAGETSAIAVERDIASGEYAAYRLAISCGR